MTTETIDRTRALGNYVTAYATDLVDELVGFVVVMQGRYVSWDAERELELVADCSGEYHVSPNGETRVGSAGGNDKVFLGRVTAPGVLAEVTWWDTDYVLGTPPEAFAAECERGWAA